MNTEKLQSAAVPPLLRLPLLFLLLCLCPATTRAATFYVDVNSTNPMPPYVTWSTASTDIQSAVDAASDGDFVWVNDGLYQTGSTIALGSTSNRVSVTKSITLQSVNGPTRTTIMGYQDPGITNDANSVRCVFLVPGAVLSGFTLANGAAWTNDPYQGGGVYCQSVLTTISNCVIIGNSGGGGVFGTYENCIIANNTTVYPRGGGGIDNGYLNNCLVTGNSANGGGGVQSGALTNCTVVRNFGGSAGGGGVFNCTLVNCIVFYNSSTGSSSASNFLDSTFIFSCTTPASGPGNSVGPNLTNVPAFMDLTRGDYRLQIGSRCIAAGTNMPTLSGTDLNGNARIVNGTVDMGAYENQFTGVVHYVSLSSTNPVPPYTNWLTAATNLQAAVNIAQGGEVVAADSGAYTNDNVVIYGAETNRVALTNGITLVGTYGPSSTLIIGGNATRCVYVGSNSTLAGFTLTHGATRTSGDITNEESGGGVWCESLNSLLLNCTIVSNNAMMYGGGVYSGILSNCLVITNAAEGPFSHDGLGGGAHGSILYHCVLANNFALFYGGGADGCVLDDCLVSNNIVYYLGYGGGVSASSLTNCLLIGNGGSFSSGTGNGGGAYSSQLYGCLIISNSAFYGGGACNGVLNNCTVVNNYGMYNGGGVIGGTWNNCIVMYNHVQVQQGGLGSNYYGGILNYCCTWPLPTTGVGNFTNAPLFINRTNNFHLQSNSPCINAGDNFYVTTAADFDGNPRIVGGTVDIGAYEYQTPTSILSYAWAQQYGLPTDGSADYLDLDGTGMKNWQKSIAGLNPTNPASVLAMLPPFLTTNTIGATISWDSVNNRLYFLQRATDLTAQPPFSAIQSNIIGQAGTTSFTDTSATNAGPYYYRIGVQ